MYKKTNNPQALRSMDRMADALIQLMEKENFKDITVLQICQEAEVARKTFYRNFGERGDVLEYALDRVMEGFSVWVGGRGMTLENEIKSCFTYCSRYKKLLNLLYKNDLFYMISRKLIVYLRETGCVEDIGEDIKGDGMELYFEQFVASTVAGVLELWVQRGFEENVDQLYNFVLRMFSRAQRKELIECI